MNASYPPKQQEKKNEGLSPASKKWLTKVIGLGCGVPILLIVLGLVIWFTKPWQYFQGSDQPAVSVQAPATVAPAAIVPPTQSESNAQPTFTKIPDGGPLADPTVVPSNKPTVRVAIPAFGTYATAAQMLVQFREILPFNLEVLPLRATGVDGKSPLVPAEIDPATGQPYIDPSTNAHVVPGSEFDQKMKMVNGSVDILFNTNDVLVRNPDMGYWIADVDQSDGGDLIAAYPYGVTPGCVDDAGKPKPIAMYNDLEGCVIGVVAGSSGDFQNSSIMRLADMNGSMVQIRYYDTLDDPDPEKGVIAAIKANKIDAAAGYTPTINEALAAGAKVIITSKWQKYIYDIIIVSRQADAEKPEAIQQFLEYYFAALKFQQEHPKEAWEMIADWNYQGVPMSGWIYVNHDTALDDGKYWIEDQYAQASLDANLVLIQAKNDVGAPELLVNRFNDIREILLWGQPSTDDNFNAADLIQTRYLEALRSRAPELRPVSGGFFNTSYSPLTNVGQAPSKEQLVKLPTVLQFGCSALDFSAGISSIDENSSSYQKLKKCAEGLKQLLATSDVQILITGSAAYPSSPDYADGVKSTRTAKERATTVLFLLSKLGVPMERMVIDWRIGTKTADEAQWQKDRWVHIDIKVVGGE